MKRDLCARRAFAGLLSLVMLAGLAAVPALADEETSAPVAETSAVTVETPAAKEETPIPEAAPAGKAETPADKAEAPAVEGTSAEAATGETDASAAEGASDKEDTPAKEDASAKDSEAETASSADASAAPSAEPVQEEELTATVAPAPARPIRLPTAVTVEETSPADTSEADDTPAAQAPAASSVGNDAEDEPIQVNDDGFTVDWNEVGLMDGGDWQASRWGIARGEGGYWVYLENDKTQARLGITYYNSSSDAIGYQAWTAQGKSLLNEGGFPIPSSTLTVVTEGANVRMEGFLPDSFFQDARFILSSGSVTLASEDIAVLDGVADPIADGGRVAKDPTVADPNASYQGIQIDGDFSDWDAVPRYDIDDSLDINGYPKSGSAVDQVSVMWDGDMVYLLLVSNGAPADYDPSLMVGNWNSVCAAGPNGNGKFAIQTDLGGELLIQPTAVGGVPAVAGINNAQVAVNNKDWAGAPHMWEIAIPADKLPTYLTSFDFGLYMVGPTITGITNFQSADGDKEFNGIVYDGNIEDWTYYPNYRIEYATPGTQDVVRDAHGALWANDNILYGYAVSNMENHLAEEGGCFLDAITLAFNGDRSHKEYPTDGNFYPRLISFESGQPIVVNDGTHLTPGDHVFYIFDERTAPDAPIYLAETGETFYPDNAYLMANAFGQMTVHVDGVKDYAEFELYLDRVAEYIDKDGDAAFKVIEIQWGRLGQQWISYGGTPTGPAISVALLLGAVCVPMGYVELKKHRRAKAAGKAQ